MKNMCNMLRGCYCHARSLLFVMKLTILVFFMGLMGVSASTYSQKTKLSLDLENVSIGEVLKTIESQSEFVFLYENEALQIDKKVSINVNDLNVDKILSEVFKGTGINFEIIDKQIVLTKASITNTDPEHPGYGMTIANHFVVREISFRQEVFVKRGLLRCTRDGRIRSA